MSNILLVAVGGALGAVSRHLVGLATLRAFGPSFPAGTMVVNLVGAFVMGVFIEVLARRWGASTELKLLIATGFLGGFTTFSSFALDAAVLWERGDGLLAALYVIGTVAIGIAALFAGLGLARHFA
ncbi:fluoride efflux transporter CrcB [Mangrovibrevibacter kandeliae]|uniref:fluoride efflux transporter CrcB n=1 Tax=Mangrovibrevibacter kandeliae TaxID=2968473 RepID=UPI0021177C1F|nr:fluoride efflux transporter CrcB [Aurantimonas sp. CSK15Z-1]MCQ8782454.1 fluoride efflux transporter CrcB [Aurantimonas sp. CSK15Z-1]